MELNTVYLQERLINSIRKYFSSRGFHEIIPRMLLEAIPLEPNIHPFSTTWTTHQDTKRFFLPTSPESSLKWFMARGIGKCFSITKAFRNHEGTSPIHNPEFLMVEWYEEGRSCEDMMDETKELVHVAAEAVNSDVIRGEEKWNQYPMPELMTRYAGVPIEDVLEMGAMVKLMDKRGYTTAGATWEQLFNQLFLNEIEPHLEKSRYYLTDYPSSISPLCAPKVHAPHLCHRFELFVDGMELANGNTENTDSTSVRSVFTNQQTERAQETHTPPVDEEFLKSLDLLSGKKVSGVGLGLDRLLMLLSGIPDIRAVI